MWKHLGCHRDVHSILWVDGKNATKQSRVQVSTFPNKQLSAQNVHGDKTEKSALKGKKEVMYAQTGNGFDAHWQEKQDTIYFS